MFDSVTGDASKIAQVLRQVKLPLVNNDDCQDALRTQFGTGLNETFLFKISKTYLQKLNTDHKAEIVL